MGDRTHRDGDNPKMSPEWHWGPLWGLVAPNGVGGTQRDGDNPKMSPKLHWGTLVGSGGTKWGQDTKGW